MNAAFSSRFTSAVMPICFSASCTPTPCPGGQKRVLRPAQNGGSEPVRIARVGKQLFGLGNVGGGGLGAEAGPVAGGEDLECRCAETEDCGTEHGVAVDHA